jgi:hypothetical protein
MCPQVTESTDVAHPVLPFPGIMSESPRVPEPSPVASTPEGQVEAWHHQYQVADTATAMASPPSLKAHTKQWMLRWMPMPFIWTRQLTGRLCDADLRDWLVLHEGAVVATGPFAGMRYNPHSARLVLPKLVGTYEAELHETFQRVIRTRYDRLINIGSAEGFYAVGFARAMPWLRVQAHDINEQYHVNLRDLAALNGTEARTTIAGTCSHAELQRFAGSSVIVVCDIEGAELELLDPDAAPALRDYDIIVEIHDIVGRSEVHDRLAERFRASHDATFIRATPRSNATSSIFPWWFPRAARQQTLDEWRMRPVPPTMPSGREWGVFWSRSAVRKSS